MEVKEGLGRYTARQIPRVRARELIEEGAKRSLRDLKSVKPYDPGKPCEIMVELVTPDRAEAYINTPGVEIPEPRLVVSRAEDWWSAWKQFWF